MMTHHFEPKKSRVWQGLLGLPFVLPAVAETAKTPEIAKTAPSAPGTLSNSISVPAVVRTRVFVARCTPDPPSP
eukprot:8245769-Pyramimonas_sp.AAC.1